MLVLLAFSRIHLFSTLIFHKHKKIEIQNCCKIRMILFQMETNKGFEQPNSASFVENEQYHYGKALFCNAGKLSMSCRDFTSYSPMGSIHDLPKRASQFFTALLLAFSRSISSHCSCCTQQAEPEKPDKTDTALRQSVGFF